MTCKACGGRLVVVHREWDIFMFGPNVVHADRPCRSKPIDVGQRKRPRESGETS